MSNIFRGKNAENGQTLEELLAMAESEEERCRLRKAWAALGMLEEKHSPAPAPSVELERIFSGQATSSRGEIMNEEDLDMIAAAGTPGYLFQGDDNNNLLVGSESDDILEGGGGRDLMYGGGGDDTMDGGDGHDRMVGGGGYDTIDGGSGDDVMDGGAGNDTLTGGEGSDTFLFGSATGNDTVTDFEKGSDTILLSGAQSMSDFTVDTSSGNTVITFGYSTITLTGVELTAEEIWAMQQQ